MYPQKSRTEIVGDLLATALDEVVTGMPFVKGEYITTTPEGEDIFADLRPSTRFWDLADKHYRLLEKEMGNDNPPSLYEAMRKPRVADEEI